MSNEPKPRASALSWREAMIAAAANARARGTNCAAAAKDRYNGRTDIERAESAGMATMALWLAEDFEYAASMAPFEGAAYVRKMGTTDSRATAAEKGKATRGYGARRTRAD